MTDPVADAATSLAEGRPRVEAVCLSGGHHFSKAPSASVELIAGLGVAGDAHAGETVQHLSRIARDPSQPNLRQVHLIHVELLDELRAHGHEVSTGDLGENVTTRGVSLLELPTGTRLHLGDDAVIEVTGLRNPCAQIDRFSPGMLKRVVGTDQDGNVVRRAGIMAVVVAGGVVRPGDGITVELPARPHRALQPV